jgi:hypothetical protein
MFVLGDYGPRSSFPYLSTFFIWQFPFYIAGIYWLIRKTHLGEIRSLMLALLLISPIPAAVTRDPYSSIRALPLVIPQIIIISLAIVELWFFLSKRSSKFIFIGSFALLVSYSLVKLYSSIIVLNEYYRANEWNYGWQQVVETINTLPSQPIVVDNTRSEPYSQLLFFLKFDPTIYQNENFEVPLNEYYTNMNRNTTKKIGTITTRPISWEQDLKDRKYLIGDSSAISDDQVDRHKLKVVKDIYFPDGSIAFRIVETSP